jgi:hypothetical protein
MNGEFWSWGIIEKGGIVIGETNWVICRNGKLINSKGNYASDKPNTHGYIANTIIHNGTEYKMRRHRLVALAFVINPRADIFTCVDHINGDKLNNRADNLRWLSQRLNLLNQKSKYSTPTPRRRTNPYRAQCCFMNKNHYLGSYATEAEAMDVQDNTRKSLFDALYHYRTKQNDFLSPEQWIVTPGCVRVKPKV